MSRQDHNDWEDDPVWKLVDDAKAPEAGPFFVRNVMREVRLSEKPAPWWRRLLAPRPVFAGALGAAAVVTLVVYLGSDHAADSDLAGASDPKSTAQPVVDEPAAEPAIDELLKEEMLFAAAEDPTAFSDEALIELLD